MMKFMDILTKVAASVKESREGIVFGTVFNEKQAGGSVLRVGIACLLNLSKTA
jgi:hypothetical protein